jgi:hypothetical protein
MTRLGMTLLTFSLFLSFPLSLHAQSSTGTIEGRVFESVSNNPVPYASVAIYGTPAGVVTDEEGRFRLTGLSPGFIRLAATSIGFEPYVSEEIYLTNAKKLTIDIPLTEKQTTIEEVTVKASPFRRQEESPVSLRRIEISEIEKSPGSNRDISKVIQSFPGVGSGVAYRNDIIVRGGGPAENRFYLDGIEIPNLNHFSTQGASGGPVGIINVDFIRGVDFYSGAFPANRGNALSSVLEFRQIDGNADKLKFKGAIGASDLAVTLDGPLSRNTTFIASARRSYLQFLFSLLKLPFLPTYNDAQFKVRSRINEKNDLTIIGLGALDQSTLNLKANETAGQRYILGYLPVNNQWNYTFGAVYKHYREHGYMSVILSRNYLSNESYKYRDNEESLGKSYDYLSTEGENHLRFEHNGHIPGSIKYGYGAGISYAEYENKTRSEIYLNDSLQERRYNSSLSMLNYGIFGQASQSFVNDRLTLSVGVRADGSNFNSTMSNPFRQLSPRVSASWMLSEKWFLNANTGIYYQRPPYTMLGFRNSAGSLVNHDDIRYMRADHLVGGVEFRSGDDSQITLEGFFKNYRHYPFSVDDSISLASKGGDYGVYGAEAVRSEARGEAYGFEWLGRFRNLAGFNTIVSYTFVVSRAINPENAAGDQSTVATSWDNRHLLNLTATRKFKHNWSAGFKWRFVGGSPYTPYDVDKSSIRAAWDARGMAYPDYALFNSRRTKSFHQLDLRIDKQYFFPKWSLNFYLDIQNAYNFKSDQPDILLREATVAGAPVTGDPYTDENGVERYKLTFIPSEGQGTILPTVGLIIEF